MFESGQRQSGIPAPELIAPRPFPEACRAIYDLSKEIEGERIYAEGNPQPLTQQTIAAWQYNMQSRLTPFEVCALRALDNVQRKVSCDD